LLPWYVNGTLTAAECEAEEHWLRQSAAAQVELEVWRRLRAAVVGQPQRSPSPAVWRRVMARVRAQGAVRQPVRARPLLAWAWGGALAAALLILLWSTVQPGVVLQWSVSDGPLAGFRVYRAPLGSADFSLLYETPAQPGVDRYTYVDARLLPGRAYVYRVEGVGRGGRSAFSRAITASALDALPAQLAILLISLIGGCGAAMLAQRRRLAAARF
jgi:hypothetical protein